jgi:hypothetical protein
VRTADRFDKPVSEALRFFLPDDWSAVQRINPVEIKPIEKIK